MFVGIRITATDPKKAAALLARFRGYPYAQRANPPAAKIVAPQGKRWTAMPPRGMEYWRRLDEVIQREPVDEHANLAKTAIVHAETSASSRGCVAEVLALRFLQTV